MERKVSSIKAPKFSVPAELLKAFHSNPRPNPKFGKVAGYIIFDRKMLVSILRSNDVAARTQLAKQIDKLGALGGELVIMDGR